MADPLPHSQAAGLEIRGPGSGLLDEPYALQARGAGGEAAVWRARLRDDDGRVWRSSAALARDLATAWAPAKASSGPLPLLQSLRPLRIDVRVELEDGRAATRTLTRLLVGDGVRIRRWREGRAATLHLPAGERPCAAIAIDATAGPLHAAAAALAAPLLASRGALALVVAPPRGGAPPGGAALAEARERLAGVPSAAGHEVVLLPALDPLGTVADEDDRVGGVGGVVLPPGIGVHGEAQDGAAARAAAWDALLETLSARPREPAER